MATKKAAKKTVGKSAAVKTSASKPTVKKPMFKSTAGKPAKTRETNNPSRKQSKTYSGSCHCGRIAFEVDGMIEQLMDCNCSMCRRRGGLLWFVSRDALRLSTPASNLSTYTFNKHMLLHRFCAHCGIAPFSEGEKKGAKMAAINARCLEGVELASLKVVKVDGRSV